MGPVSPLERKTSISETSLNCSDDCQSDNGICNDGFDAEMAHLKNLPSIPQLEEIIVSKDENKGMFTLCFSLFI